MSKIFDIALSQIGTKEFKGALHNKKVLEYFKVAGFPNIQNDEVAWCAAYVNFCLVQSGFIGSNKLTARSLLKVGKEVAKPITGDIVVLWRESPKSWKGHVGFYVREDNSHIYVLGGNQSNSVNIAPYKKERLLGYRRVDKQDLDTCGCDLQEVNPEYCLTCPSDVPTIKIKLLSLVPGINFEKYKSKIYNTVQNQLKIPLKVVAHEFLTNYWPQKYNLEAIYESNNLDQAVKIAKANQFNGITIIVGESNTNLKGFSLPWLNTVFVNIESYSKYSSTIAHEIGHDLGLNHTFSMTQEEKNLFGIEGDSEEFNLMNYSPFTDHITPQQTNYIHNTAAEKY